jgi:hypothetical protein
LKEPDTLGTNPFCIWAWKLFYNAGGFGKKPRSEFLSALNAEGIPCSSGYGSPLSKEGGIKRVAELYPEIIKEFPCPNTERVCAESVWLFQNI